MIYAVSNLHGEYNKFKKLLEKINFSDKDTLYVLGDIVDYGPESMELVEDLSYRLNVYSIAGEHDFKAVRMLTKFDEMLKSGSQPDADYIREMTEWVADGGQATLEGFRALGDDAKEGVLDYLSDLSLFEEAEVNGTDYLMVHAGIADYSPDKDLEDYSPEEFFDEPLDAGYRLIDGKTLIVGHVPTKTSRITKGEGSIFIDCGVCEGGNLGCICLDSGEEFYVS